MLNKFAGFACFFLALSAVAAEPDSTLRRPALHVMNPQAVFSSPTVGAAYGDLIVPGRDTLTSASSPCCAAVEFHTTQTNSNGVMSMRKLGSVATTGTPIQFRPAGTPGPGNPMHLMLINAKKPFKPGDTIPITFQFSNAGTQTANFPVIDAKAQAHAMPMDHSMGGMTMDAHTP